MRGAKAPKKGHAVSRVVTIVNRRGLHARAAGKL